jgi:arylsulfatase A-like enzyme
MPPPPIALLYHEPARATANFADEDETEIPFVVRWPARIKPAVSSALVSQVDLIASLAALVGRPPLDRSARDSENVGRSFGRPERVPSRRASRMIPARRPL